MSNSIPVLFFDDGSQFPLPRPGQYTIGSDNCDIQLPDADVLPLHAALISAGAKVMLKPEAGAQILVNGQPIAGMVSLNNQDTFTIGTHTITINFMLKTMAPPAPVLPRTGKNPFEFDETIFQSAPPPTPAPPSPAPAIPPPAAIEDIDEPEPEAIDEIDEEEDFDDALVREESGLQPIATHNSNAADEVGFTAYYPREFPASQRGSVIIYAHIADAVSEITRDVRKFTEELGGEVPRPRSATNRINIQPGTPITIELESEHLDFDPPALTRRWDDEWVRFVFDFKALPAYSGEQIIFHVAVLVHGIEVARIANCALEILPPDDQTPAVSSNVNPLAQANMTYEEAQLYQRIFVSYSRQDTEVVEAYRLAQQAIGNEVFMDTYSIRAGQDWQSALAQAIRDADIFQLFWSAGAAGSDNVRDEWDYALKYRCNDDGCRGFIRPVFWVNPMPVAPPQELQHLNFRYVPLGEKHT